MRRSLHDLIAFFSPLVLYLTTMLPTLHLGDSGELTVGATMFAVPHVPGYPLLATLGHAFAQLPLAHAAWRGNLFSVFFGALTVWMTYRLLRELTGDKLVALAAALAFAGTYTLWEQSLKIRAYPLNTFFAATVIYFALRWRNTFDRRYLLTCFFVFGLGLSNHEILLVVGAVPIALIIANWKQVKIRDLLLSLTFAGLGVSVYLYIPLRAAAEPVLNWGEPNTWPRLLDALSQQQYSAKMLNPDWHNKWQMLKLIGWSFIDEVGVPVFALALAGLAGLIKRERALLVGLLALVLVNILLRINYIGEDEMFQVRRYLISGYLALIIGLAAALNWIKQVLHSRFRIKTVPVLTMLILVFVAVWPTMRHARANEQSANWVAYEAWQNVLSHRPLSYGLVVGGDNNVFPLWYLQMVERRRPTVAVLPREGFRSDWVIDMVAGRLPPGVIAMRPEYVKPELHNPLFLSTAANLIDESTFPLAFIADHITPAADDAEFQKLKASVDTQREGAITWWLVDGQAPIDDPTLIWRFYQTASIVDRSLLRDHHTATVTTDYSVYYSRFGRQREKQGDNKGAAAAYRLALAADPGNDAVMGQLGALFARNDQLDEAVDLYRAAIELNPREWRHFYNLSLVLRAAGKNDEAEQAEQTAQSLKETRP